MYSLFIWNSIFAERPVFYLATLLCNKFNGRDSKQKRRKERALGTIKAKIWKLTKRWDTEITPKITPRCAGKKSSQWYLHLTLEATLEPVSLAVQSIKSLPAMRETWVRCLNQKDPMKKEIATHSSTLTWRIPMDGGAWQATVHGVVKIQTQLRD